MDNLNKGTFTIRKVFVLLRFIGNIKFELKASNYRTTPLSHSWKKLLSS